MLGKASACEKSNRKAQSFLQCSRCAEVESGLKLADFIVFLGAHSL
jgi:hypothetical protein